MGISKIASYVSTLYMSCTYLETKSVKMLGGIDFCNISCKTDSVTFAIVLLFQPAMWRLWQATLTPKSKLKRIEMGIKGTK